MIDAELALVTNGGITTDKVGPHTDYLGAFPYVGDPHGIPLAATPIRGGHRREEIPV